MKTKNSPAVEPKTGEAPEGTLPVSETSTPENKLAALPEWLQDELITPAPVGDRNNHCIKIAPALLRNGYTPSEALVALQRLYPQAKQGELEGVVKRSEVYAETERESDPEWQAKRARLEELTTNARAAIPHILENYQLAEIDTPDWDLAIQRRKFLAHMFGPEDVVWIGEPTQSGPRFKHHFRSIRTWMASLIGIPGEFITHSTFKPGSVSRNTESILTRKYLVLESDTRPPGELASIAAYLRDHHCLILRAIVTTGGKRFAPEPGLHFWFNYPGDSMIDDWEAVLRGYGADVATLRGPQPVRLPGCIRKSTGLAQEVWWLS